MSAQQLVRTLIDSHNVLVFAKSYCPFCNKVKQLFKSLNVVFHSEDLDLQENGAAIQEELFNISGQKTVPNVFINKKHIGGCDKVHELHQSGQLMRLINKN
jgi:glutaredoxin